MIIIITLSGCSALGKMTVLHPESVNEGWMAQPLNPERPHPVSMQYQFRHKTVTVITCPLDVGIGVVGIGPPLIPIIPGALFPYTRFDPLTEYNNEDFFFHLQIVSPLKSTAIDFSKIQVWINGSDTGADIKSVRRYSENERWPNVCHRHLAEVGLEEISAQQVVTKGDAQYLLFFDFPWRKVKTFSLDIGSISISDQDVKLPSLRYRRNSYYCYTPFIVPPGGHGQEPWGVCSGF